MYCIVLCKSVVSEGKELISNWPIRFQETRSFLFLIGQFDINSFPSLTTDLQSTIMKEKPGYIELANQKREAMSFLESD